MALRPEVIKSRIDPLIALFNEYVIRVLFLLMTVVFIWGLVLYVSRSQDEKARKQAKAIMTWGIIGLFVVTAAWGITRILILYFGVGGVGIPTVSP